MKRYIVYWEGQDIEAVPPAKVCAAHRDSVVEQLKPHIPAGAALVTEQTDDGPCALVSFNNCGDN